MVRIGEEKQKHLFRKSPFSVVAAAVVLSLFTGIAAYATGVFEIKSKSGEVTFATEQLDENSYVVRNHGYNLEPSAAELRSQKILEEIQSKQPAGTILAVYINDADMNPKNTISWLLSPWTFKSEDQYQNELRNRNFPAVKGPGWVPDGFTFSEGKLLMEVNDYNNHEQLEKELHNEAKQNGQLVITRPGVWSDKPHQSVVVYSNGTQKLTFSANFTGTKRLFVSKNAYVENIKINEEQEAFYIEDRERNEKLVTWTKEAQPRTVYRVSIDFESAISKETPIKIAAGMK